MTWEQIKPGIYTTWKTYWFDTHPHDIAQYSWDYLFTGGKQIRPRLFCELWHYLSPDLNASCGELAFAMECIHVASLILDDLPWMDNAPERRGKATLHTIFSERKALLLFHDVLYMVYLLWTNNKPAHVELYEWEKFMVEKLMYLSLGQWYDLEKKGTLIELASLKTGILFELVTETVALCIELDRPFWRSWGNHLGILFQWMDDLHDREEDLEQGNRNAFNESYDTTLKHYITIWKQIETGIGRSWFERPFGLFMKSYFTDTIIIDTPPMFNVLLIDIPYPVVIEFPSFSLPVFSLKATYPIGSHYIKKLYDLLYYASKNIDKYADYIEKYKTKYMKRYQSIMRLLWNTYEKSWEHQPYVIALATDLYQESRKDIKEIIKRK
jgi:hypothetical protein